MVEEKKQQTKIVGALRRGQVTIPAEFRKELGIADDSLFQMRLVDGELRLRPVQVREKREGKGSPWLKELSDHFAPVREEFAATGYAEEEINAWIDQALADVRAEQG